MLTETTTISAWDRIMMAIAFAEENEPQTAREILREGEKPRSEARKTTQAPRPELRV